MREKERRIEGTEKEIYRRKDGQTDGQVPTDRQTNRQREVDGQKQSEKAPTGS